MFIYRAHFKTNVDPSALKEKQKNKMQRKRNVVLTKERSGMR